MINTRKRLVSLIQSIEASSSFLVFSIIYIPVAFLFLNRGTVAEVSLAIYTIIMFVWGLFLIGKFILYIAERADSHNGQMGSVLVVYMMNMFIPLVIFKVLGYVGWGLLPISHRGIVCDMKWYIMDLYRIFNFQHTLTLLIASSLILMALATVWSIMKKQ